MNKAHSDKKYLLGRITVVVAGVVLLGSFSDARSDIAFQYEEITEPIISATFTVDFAAMNAHRTIGENEMNYAILVDCNSGGGLPDFDLSDDLFGTTTPPEDPQVDMGVLETGWISAEIDSSFYPALAGGSVGLKALFTDTVDSKFAMDFISLNIETSSNMTESYYGWPVGSENNGFGIGLNDGDDLPEPLPDSLPIGTTGTGFDETISSMSILAIPEPATLILLAISMFALRRR